MDATHVMTVVSHKVVDEEFVNIVIIKIRDQTFCTVAFMLS